MSSTTPENQAVFVTDYVGNENLCQYLFVKHPEYEGIVVLGSTAKIIGIASTSEADITAIPKKLCDDYYDERFFEYKKAVVDFNIANGKQIPIISEYTGDSRLKNHVHVKCGNYSFVVNLETLGYVGNAKHPHSQMILREGRIGEAILYNLESVYGYKYYIREYLKTLDGELQDRGVSVTRDKAFVGKNYLFVKCEDVAFILKPVTMKLINSMEEEFERFQNRYPIKEVVDKYLRGIRGVEENKVVNLSPMFKSFVGDYIDYLCTKDSDKNTRGKLCQFIGSIVMSLSREELKSVLDSHKDLSPEKAILQTLRDYLKCSLSLN